MDLIQIRIWVQLQSKLKHKFVIVVNMIIWLQYGSSTNLFYMHNEMYATRTVAFFLLKTYSI